MKKLGPQDAEAAHADAMALGARCPECPLWGCRSGPVLGEVGRLPLIVVAKGPGVEEVERGRPHIGRGSQDIRRVLGKAHMTNAWLCRSPPPTGDDMAMYVRRLRLKDRTRQKAEDRAAKREGRKPRKLPATPTPAQCCAPRLVREIAESGANTVMPLGVDALKAIASAYGIPYGKSKEERADRLAIAGMKAQMGHPLQIPAGTQGLPRAITVFASMHPAAAGDGRGMPHMAHVIEAHMHRAKQLAKDGGRWIEPKPDELTLPPEIWNKAFFYQIKDWVVRYEAAGRPELTVDVETDGIDWYTKVRCVGLGADIPIESIIVVPLRYRDGRPYWPPKADAAVRKLLKRLLNG